MLPGRKGSRMKRILACLLIFLLLGAGCRAPGTAQAAPTPSPAAEPAPTEAPQAEPAVTEAPVEEAAPAPEEESAPSEAPAEYAFSFTAQTLEGETVTEAVFSEHDLTMVNVWASWCPPCRGELSELGALYDKLPENVGFLSVTVDDAGDLPAAAKLLEQHGCAFTCLDGQGSPGLMAGFLGQVMAIPTTVFFDRAGNQVGQWIVGVPQGSGSVSEAYLAEIEARLAQLNK